VNRQQIFIAASLSEMASSTSKYATSIRQKIPARSGVAVPIGKGQTIQVINTHGTQVVDTWAVSPDLKIFMSMCHTRAYNNRLTPLPGDVLVSNHRQPMLEFVEDTTPSGIHDTIIAACDIHRYHQLGVPESEYHNSCTDNYRNALRDDVGMTLEDDLTPPDPFNLFMNIPVHPNPATTERINADEVPNLTATASLSFEAPVCRPGDYVKLKALVDCIVVLSACPQDILKINDQDPTDAHFIINTA
jgi:uncharacterized protein YcgI (DUF1989 family)